MTGPLGPLEGPDPAGSVAEPVAYVDVFDRAPAVELNRSPGVETPYIGVTPACVCSVRPAVGEGVDGVPGAALGRGWFKTAAAVGVAEAAAVVGAVAVTLPICVPLASYKLPFGST